MKKLFCFYLFVFSLIGTGWARVQVSVSILPQKYFVEKIGGNLVQVNVMVGKGADPHTYEPKPRKMVSLSRSKIYFFVGGIEFEETWLPKFRKINSHLKFVNTTFGIPRLKMAEHHHDESSHHDDEEEEEGEGNDPHLWLSPLLVKIQALHIYEALIQEDPTNQKAYWNNYQKFQKEIDLLYLKMKKLISPVKNSTLMVFHPSWGYLANDFGLKQLPIEIEGKRPKPAQLLKIIRIAKRKKIKVIFAQPQFSKQSAQVIAREIGGKVIVIDPLAENWTANLYHIAKQIHSALSL